MVSRPQVGDAVLLAAARAGHAASRGDRPAVDRSRGFRGQARGRKVHSSPPARGPVLSARGLGLRSPVRGRRPGPRQAAERSHHRLRATGLLDRALRDRARGRPRHTAGRGLPGQPHRALPRPRLRWRWHLRRPGSRHLSPASERRREGAAERDRQQLDPPHVTSAGRFHRHLGGLQLAEPGPAQRDLRVRLHGHLGRLVLGPADGHLSARQPHRAQPRAPQRGQHPQRQRRDLRPGLFPGQCDPRQPDPPHPALPLHQRFPRHLPGRQHERVPRREQRGAPHRQLRHHAQGAAQRGQEQHLRLLRRQRLQPSVQGAGQGL